MQFYASIREMTLTEKYGASCAVRRKDSADEGRVL